MVKQKLQDRVALLMKRENLSSQQLALKIDKHVTTIDRIKHGAVLNPPDATLRMLADALNTPFEYLKTGEGPDALPAKADANAVSDPYRDYAIQRLEKEVDTWQQKYQQVWDRFTNLLERVPLGKYKPAKETAYAATGTNG